MSLVSDDPTDPGFTPDARDKLRSHFLNKPPAEHVGHWDELWQKQVVPWDRKLPNPALVDILNEKTNLIGGPASQNGKRKRALVPGCGRGYDVLLFASYGYDAYGLDASKTALEACKKLEKEEGDTQYAAKDEDQGKGLTKFVFADFFKDDWFVDGISKFDVIYDYTFLCALPPELRPAWAKRQSELLADDGKLVCLEFPTAKPPSTGGPPFGLSPPLYVELFSQPGRDVQYDGDGYVVPQKQANDGSGQGALTRVEHWQPERTHAVGQGTDWVSIWQHA